MDYLQIIQERAFLVAQRVKNLPAMREIYTPLYEYTTVCLCVLSHLCPTLCNPMNYSLPGCSVHGILQARILEQFAISFCRGPF